EPSSARRGASSAHRITATPPGTIASASASACARGSSPSASRASARRARRKPAAGAAASTSKSASTTADGTEGLSNRYAYDQSAKNSSGYAHAGASTRRPNASSG